MPSKKKKAPFLKTKPTKREQKTISRNVEKLVREWEKTGKIKTSRATYKPKTKEEAIKQALAIEYGRIKQKRKKSK
ncbi:MAG: hypothetical protein ABIL76_06790 [candidate division WOR-3 bacterium]